MRYLATSYSPLVPLAFLVGLELELLLVLLLAATAALEVSVGGPPPPGAAADAARAPSAVLSMPTVPVSRPGLLISCAPGE